MLVTSYPANEKNLLVWVIITAISGEDSVLEELKSWLADDIFDQNIALIWECINNALKRNSISMAKMNHSLGPMILHKILHWVFTRPELPSCISNYIFSEIEQQNATVDDLEEWYGHDNSRKIIADFLIFYQRKNQWWLDRVNHEDNIIYTLILKKAVTLQTAVKYSAQHIACLENPFVAAYLEAGHAQAFLAFNLFSRVSRDKLFLIPLLIENMLSIETVERMCINSTIYFAYQHFLQTANWNNKEMCRSQFRQINLLFSSNIVHFLEFNVFAKMNSDIENLKAKTATFYRVDGNIKAQQLSIARAELIQLTLQCIATLHEATAKSINDSSVFAENIYRHDKIEEKASNNEALAVAIKLQIAEKLIEIAERKTINNYRNQIAGYLKALAGIMISSLLLFVPLFSQRYRQLFFPSATSVTVRKIATKLQALDPDIRQVRNIL